MKPSCSSTPPTRPTSAIRRSRIRSTKFPARGNARSSSAVSRKRADSPECVAALPLCRRLCWRGQRAPAAVARPLASACGATLSRSGFRARPSAPSRTASTFSMRAASLVGPKIGSARDWKRFTIPASSGCSGPTTVRSTRSSSASVASCLMLSAAIGTHRARVAIPGLPGAASSSALGSSRRIFQASACSRPPPPTIRIFTVRSSRSYSSRAASSSARCDLAVRAKLHPKACSRSANGLPRPRRRRRAGTDRR